ncbi:MAG: hypothetical protein K0Q83_1577, partial [Deltaproteobacteria bacterium]|nr:hypothetical protein [Deltaproteobacteria bacterium]
MGSNTSFLRSSLRLYHRESVG